jgi:hypothetical protein
MGLLTSSMPCRRRVALVIFGVLLSIALRAGPGLGQEPGVPGAPGEPREEEALEFRNEVAAIVAATWEDEEDETFFTLGMEYERRLTPRIGIVGEVEYLFDADRWIVVAPLAFRPVRGLKIFAGPAFERGEAEDEEGEERKRRGSSKTGQRRATRGFSFASAPPMR